MIHRSIAQASSGLVALAVLIPASNSLADTDATERPGAGKNQTAENQKADAPVAPKAKPVEKTTLPAKPAAAALCNCGPARPPLPLYVEDWGRLADLTQSDPVVFSKADFWRNRQDTSRWLFAGVILRSGAAALATFDRLGTGRWTDTNKWMLAGGLSAAVLSVLSYWAFAPNRDDLLTVINHWNLRHPDQTLAP
jgi:hypothetical protein